MHPTQINVPRAAPLNAAARYRRVSSLAGLREGTLLSVLMALRRSQRRARGTGQWEQSPACLLLSVHRTGKPTELPGSAFSAPGHDTVVQVTRRESTPLKRLLTVFPSVGAQTLAAAQRCSFPSNNHTPLFGERLSIFSGQFPAQNKSYRNSNTERWPIFFCLN